MLVEGYDQAVASAADERSRRDEIERGCSSTVSD